MISPIALAFIVAANHQPFSLKRSSFDFVTVCQCKMECVMSRQYNRYVASSRIKLEPQPQPLNFFKLAAGIDKIAVYAPDPREAAPLPKPILTNGERLALLKLRRNEASRRIYDALIANGASHPDRRSFHPLIDYGYARKPDAAKWHSITSLGSYEADLIVRSLAGKFGVHVYSERDCNWQVGAHCCCGWSSTVQKGIHSSANLQGHFRRHVATANGVAGLVKLLKPAGTSEAT